MIAYNLASSVASPIAGFVSHAVLSEVHHRKLILIIIICTQTCDGAAHEALHGFWGIR